MFFKLVGGVFSEFFIFCLVVKDIFNFLFIQYNVNIFFMDGKCPICYTVGFLLLLVLGLVVCFGV